MFLPRLLRFVFLLICGVSQAQVYEFEHITDKDGLINNSVTSIIRDKDGFMWFGTMNGLSRYDGYSFKQFLHDPTNKESIKDNHIKCLLQSSTGKIYIGFRYHGFTIYDKKSERFKNFAHHPDSIKSLNSNNVSTILEDKSGNIWIGTDKGLDKFDCNTKRFTHYYPFSHKQFGFVSSISEDAQGILWLYGMGTELCKFDPVRETKSYLKFSDNKALNAIFVLGGQVKCDHAGNLWIGNELDGILKYNLKTGNIEKFNIENGKTQSNVVLFIFEDSENTVWIGTDGAGLYAYNSGVLRHIYQNVDNPTSLSGTAIYCIYESEPGMLWFGAYASGINIWIKNKKKFNSIWNEGEAGKRLNVKSVISMCDGKDGNIWLGTDGGGITLFNAKKRTCIFYTEENSPVCGGSVKSIEIDSEKNVWCGTYGNGLCQIDFRTGTSKNYVQDVTGSEHTIDKNHIWSLRLIDDKMWIGTLKGQINIYDFKTGKFLHNPFPNKKNYLRDITTIYKDSRNRFWFGSETLGMLCYDSVGNSYTPFVKGKGINTFPSNNVRDIIEDKMGNMWFATQKGGLVKLVNDQHATCVAYTIKDGLPSNNIRKIIEDFRGNLWLSTDKGICCFYVKEGFFRNFDSEDGLQGNEFNASCGLQTSDGFIYFGGLDGLCFFHPDSIFFNSVTPRIVLTDFKIFNQSIHPNTLYNTNTYLKESVTTAKEILINYEDYAFTIEFSALDFNAPLKNKYAYKLEGFDEKWVHVSADKRFATYTNLDPGEYTFNVIACNNDGVWNIKGTTLKITITPPWWMNHLLGAGILLLFIGACILLYYLRLRNIHKQNRLLEDEVKKRTLELIEKNKEISTKSKILEQNNYAISTTNDRILSQQLEILKQKDALEQANQTKDRFFSIIGHDLRNPVNALSFLITQMKEESKKFEDENYQKLMAQVENSATGIQRLVLNLLEWAKTKSANIVVKEECFDVYAMIQEQVKALAAEAKIKNIDIIILSEQKLYAWADRNMVGAAVKNILSNGIKFTSSGGKIKIDTLSQQDSLSISISDTGIGMGSEMKNKLFKIDESFSTQGTIGEPGTGLGLLIAHELLLLNKCKINIESEIGKGSTFTIFLSK